MNISEIVSDFLTGDPVVDSIVIGVLFSCFFSFYDILFSAISSIFKKN